MTDRLAEYPTSVQVSRHLSKAGDTDVRSARIEASSPFCVARGAKEGDVVLVRRVDHVGKVCVWSLFMCLSVTAFLGLILLHTCTPTFAHMRALAHSWKNAQTQERVHRHAHKCTPVYTHTHVHTQTQAYTVKRAFFFRERSPTCHVASLG